MAASRPQAVVHSWEVGTRQSAWTCARRARPLRRRSNSAVQQPTYGGREVVRSAWTPVRLRASSPASAPGILPRLTGYFTSDARLAAAHGDQGGSTPTAHRNLVNRLGYCTQSGSSAGSRRRSRTSTV